MALFHSLPTTGFGGDKGGDEGAGEDGADAEADMSIDRTQLTMWKEFDNIPGCVGQLSTTSVH